MTLHNFMWRFYSKIWKGTKATTYNQHFHSWLVAIRLDMILVVGEATNFGAHQLQVTTHDTFSFVLPFPPWMQLTLRTTPMATPDKNWRAIELYRFLNWYHSLPTQAHGLLTGLQLWIPMLVPLIFIVSYASDEQGYSVVEVVECLGAVQVHKHMFQASKIQSSQYSYSWTMTFTLSQRFDIQLARAQCFESGAVLWNLGEVEGAQAGAMYLMFATSDSEWLEQCHQHALCKGLLELQPGTPGRLTMFMMLVQYNIESRQSIVGTAIITPWPYGILGDDVCAGAIYRHLASVVLLLDVNKGRTSAINSARALDIS
ncbi:hypothetical protein ARMGADRAFT_1068330 [Armillaria gallica]|uniref:Uncharacterized protein n=1 Tax=Armillaria gallica TaxID=47427 RepID=A0A2H3CSG5_ARMGA|nr:hypothetical protein ARMGADRAFT_1068330 [Armillaria gallica]